MQQLHLVGFTADLEGLIFSAKKGARSGAFVVAMDDALLTALEEARKMVSAAAGVEDDLQRTGRAKQLPALGRSGRPSGTPCVVRPGNRGGGRPPWPSST